jgi:serine/threonine protein kinase
MMHPKLFCDDCGMDNQSLAVNCRSCGHSLQTGKTTIYHPRTGHLLAKSMLKQRYRIIELVAKGGMGAVYRAEDTQLGNRQVALKEMRQSSLNPQQQKQAAGTFREEAMMLARLQHPSLPSIFDHFEENGRWYLVMSFLKGETLAAYLKRAQGGKLPLDEALQIGIQLCTVLEYLHSQQPAIVFRDLKPSNIIRAPDGHLYLVDFGIARHFKPGQAKDTVYYGSMGYAPLEQYGKAQTTPRSDIYSLGATLHHMLSGNDPSHTPFRLPPLRFPHQFTGLAKLTALITSMLDMDPQKRPVNVAVVRQTLEEIANRRLHPSQPPIVLTPSSLPLTEPTPPPPIPNFPSSKRHFSIIAVILTIILTIGGYLISAPTMHPTPQQQSASHRRLALAYHGNIHNITMDTTATLELTSIVQNQQVISGNVVIGPGLMGSGPFTGTIKNDGSVSFTDLSTDGSNVTLIFSGSLHTDGSLDGTYTVPTAEGKGTWQTTPSSSAMSRQFTSYPRLALTYQGNVHNTTMGSAATLELTSIVENQQVISGNVVIGSGLMGSGPFTGTIMNDGSVSFVDRSTDGSNVTLVFSGSLQADGSLDGTYTVPAANGRGTWHTKPS